MNTAILESSFNQSIIDIVEGHDNVLMNLERKKLIQHVLDNREAMPAKNGALATWTAPESTGRRPLDTYVVKRKPSEKNPAYLIKQSDGTEVLKLKSELEKAD